MMRAVVFRGKGQIGVEEVPKPVPGPGEAVGSRQDHRHHHLRHRCAHRPRRISCQGRRLVLGQEPVGVIEELGPEVAALRRAAASAQVAQPA